MTLELPSAGRVLVVAAHPDDVDFGVAGTVALLAGSGCTVAYLVVTDGDAGGFDRSLRREDLPAIRRAEQRAAAKVVGVEEVAFLGRSDGTLTCDLGLRREISRQIRSFRPDLVICPSPERDLDLLPASHPDHLAAGEAALCAVYPDARNPFAFPELLSEGLEPHSVGEVWLMAHPGAEQVVDVTEVLDKKLAAIAAHASQLPDPAEVEERVRSWTALAAERHGLGPGRHAETFRVVHLP